MQFFSKSDIQSWSRFYRGNFINSLSGFKSATLIGTKSSDDRPNLAIFSNIVHIGADPAFIGFINRPADAAPHTIANIQSTGIYSMNLITEAMVEQAHQTSAKYATGENEFEQTGLTAEFHPGFEAPFVQQSPVKYAMELKEIISIALNNTFLVIGAVTGVFAEEKLLKQNGFIALEEAAIITSLGIDGYYGTRQLARFSYAKPHQALTRLTDDDV